MNNRITPSENQAGQFSVMLPCSPDQFRDFISGLLGKPQTITQRLTGNFEIGKQDLVNIHHLLNQRVEQQNHGTLIQFTARIIFDDGSSVLLNSIDDLMNYHEVRSVISLQAHLSWTYLIKFADKEFPEKQVVDVSFVTAGLQSLQDEDGTVIAVERMLCKNRGGVNFRIQHTARTWGADVQALLANHFESVLTKEPKVKQAILNHAGKITLVMCGLVWLFAFWGMYNAGASLTRKRDEVVKALLGSKVELTSKFDGVLRVLSENAFEGFLLSCIGYMVFAFFFSIILCVWTENVANAGRPSFLLLTTASEKDMRKQLSSYRWKWGSFVGSVIFSLVTGIVSSVIFESYWKG